MGASSLTPGLVLRSLLLPAEELDRAVRFYQDAVGLGLLMRDGGDYAELDAGGVKLALATPVDHPLPEAILPTFKTTDLEPAVARLTAGGAVVVTPARQSAHETRVVLRDPVGNPFVVYSTRS